VCSSDLEQAAFADRPRPAQPSRRALTHPASAAQQRHSSSSIGSAEPAAQLLGGSADGSLGLTRPEQRGSQHRSTQRAAHSSSPALALQALSRVDREPQVLPLSPRQRG